VNEIGIGDDVKIFGGGMVGLQFAAVMSNLGSLLNGVVNYNTWLPESSMYFDGTKAFFDAYTKRAIEAKVDPLGYYLAVRLCDGQMVERRSTPPSRSTRRASRNICAKTNTRPSSPDRICGGWRAQGKRDAAGAIPGREGQGHRAVPVLRQAGDPVPG